MSDLKITFADQEPPDADYKKLYELQRYTSKKLCIMLLQYIDMLCGMAKHEGVSEALAQAKEDLERLLLEI